MGLILDGVYKDVEYKQKELNAVDAAKVFGLDGELFPKGYKTTAPVVFELHKSKAKKVRGQQRCINSLSLPTTFTINKDGETIQVTYFDKKIKKTNKENGNQYFEYLPLKTKITRKVTPLLRGKMADLIVFLALNPQCHTSPLAPLNHEKSFGLKNFEKEASDFMVDKAIESEIMQDILNTPEPVLRLRAKGFGVSGVDNMSFLAIQAELLRQLERAKQNLDSTTMEMFRTKWNAGYSSLKGQVQECVDCGFIVQQPIPGGKLEYKWREGLLAEGQICIVERGMKPFDFLLNHITNNWGTYKNLVGDALKYGNTNNDDSIRENEDLLSGGVIVKKTNAEMTPTDIANAVILEQLVMYNPMTKGIHYTNKDGLEKEPFMVVEMKTYIAELALELEKNAEMLTLMKNKLKGKAMANGKQAKKDEGTDDKK